MLYSGQAGFYNTPVTKVVIALVVTTTLFGSILGSQKRLVLDLAEAFGNYQLWRLVTHHFVFSTPGELLFGVVLLYYFRQFERQMGSAKFAGFVTFATTFYTGALCTILSLFPNNGASNVSISGPYAIIFAEIVHFIFATPALYTFQLVGFLGFSDKSFPYLLALQLALSAPSRSLLPVCISLVAGLLLRISILEKRLQYVYPQPVVNLVSSLILPLLNTVPPASTGRPARRVRTRGRNGNREQGMQQMEERPRPPVGLNTEEAQRTVSGSNIDTLIAMGFSRQRAIDALVAANDNIQHATETLLTSR